MAAVAEKTAGTAQQQLKRSYSSMWIGEGLDADYGTDTAQPPKNRRAGGAVASSDNISVLQPAACITARVTAFHTGRGCQLSCAQAASCSAACAWHAAACTVSDGYAAAHRTRFWSCTAHTCYCDAVTGVIIHPTSLPGPYGIGEIGVEAFKLVDWMVSAGLSLWQASLRRPNST